MRPIAIWFFGTTVKALLVAGFSASSICSIWHNRDILLTGVYKFSYPRTLAWIELLISLALGLVAHLVIKICRYMLSTVIASQVDNPFCKHDDLNESTSHLLPSQTLRVSGPPDLGALLRMRGLGPLDLTLNVTSSWRIAFLSLGLTARTLLGNFLLSRLAVSDFLLVHVLALPFILVCRSAYEQTYQVMLACFAAVTMVLAIIPNLTTIGLVPCIAISIYICSNIATIELLRVHIVAFLQDRGISIRQWDSPRIQDTFCLRLQTVLDLLSTILHVILQAIAGSLIGITIILILSGEPSLIRQNCYVLDVPAFWTRVIGASGLLGASILCYWTFAVAFTSLFVSLLDVPVCTILSIVFYHQTFAAQTWLHIGTSIALPIFLHLQARLDVLTSTNASKRTFYVNGRRAIAFIIAYSLVYEGIIFSNEYLRQRTEFSITTENGGQLAGSETVSFSNNITFLADQGDPAFNGPRPSDNTYADFNALIRNCDEGAATGVEGVVKCLNYLADYSSDYLIDPGRAASKRHDKCSDSGLSPTLCARFGRRSPKAFSIFPSSKLSIPKTGNGICSGPRRLYHTYWTGPATWRFELFIKAYLHSQNLACSKLWIWLDTDISKDALRQMTERDPLFSNLRPLLEDEFIVFKEWSTPEQILLPEESLPFNTSRSPDGNLSSSASIPREIVQDKQSGQFFLKPDMSYSKVATPTQVSDFVRFFVLHRHGGVYLDMDILLMRDLRPLLLPASGLNSSLQPSWAEQWVERCKPGDYNSAVLSLPANSTLTSYLLYGAVRMGMNFHPRVLGHMLYRDGRLSELPMLQNAFFDPLVTNLRREDSHICTVPCHKNFQSAFVTEVDEPEREWIGLSLPHRKLGARYERDRFSALGTNRTMAQFFRGAFAYHIHNQWWKFPQRDSWMDVITRDHDAFFSGNRTNTYGEMWDGPPIAAYNRSKWGWH